GCVRVGRAAAQAVLRVGSVLQLSTGVAQIIETEDERPGSPGGEIAHLRVVAVDDDGGIRQRRDGAAPAGGDVLQLAVAVELVAETRTVPRGRRAASRSIAAGSSFQSSFPGRVVPPPRPASRESPPAARAAAASRASGIGGRTGQPYRDSPLLAFSPTRSTILGVPRKPYRVVAGIDPQALAEFQAGIRRRY